MTSTVTSTVTTTASDDTDHEAAASITPLPPGDRYLRPGWFTRRVFNPVVARLVKLGVSMKGARELQVRGRTSGEWRTTPVNVLELDGRSYLVAPRGETQWVKNLRATGEGRLRSGRRIAGFTAAELADDQKPAVLREYLRLWAWEVGRFFDDLHADSPDAAVAAAAQGFPVFEIAIA